MNMEDHIFRIIVPMEEELQVKDGKKKLVKRKVFPGYVLVEMVLTDDSWYVVRNTPGVTGFVGTGNKPVPLKEEEAQTVLEQLGVIEGRIKVFFSVGESVRVKDGPFEDFIGVVEEISPEKGKMRVLVSMFGRETPVELEFYQVERI